MNATPEPRPDALSPVFSPYGRRPGALEITEADAAKLRDGTPAPLVTLAPVIIEE